MRQGRGIVAALVLSGWARVAHADVKQECNAAYDDTQALRKNGKLVAARERAVACSLAECTYAKKDCIQWLAEIDASMPTVVFTAEDTQGADTAAVRVVVDGKPLVERLDGKALPLDPGEHTIRFEMAGADAIEQKALIREGDKNRRIGVAFKKAAAPAAPATLPSQPPPDPSSGDPYEPAAASSGGAPTWAWVTGGLGLVSAGVGVGFVVAQSSGQGEIDDHCAKTPPEPGYDPASCVNLQSSNNVKQGLAWAFTGAGIVALGVAVVAIVTAPPRTQRASARPRVHPTPWIAPTLAGASLAGAF